MTLGRLAALAFVSVAALVMPPSADAQQGQRTARVAWFALSSRAGNEDIIAAFRDRLHRLGYEDGRNLAIEYRFADGSTERLAGLAAELARAGVDVIVASSTPSTMAAKDVTRTIPIVMVGVGNPDESGLVSSLARPGGNVTGVSGAYGDFAAKWVELLREVAPKATRVGYLYNPGNRDNRLRSKHVVEAGPSVGVTVRPFLAATPAEVEAQLGAMGKARIDAVVVDSDGTLRTRRQETVDFAARARLPAIYANQDYVDVGGLMSYGPSRLEIGRRAADYVDRILKGAKPGDLPVERPTRFELAINVRAAKGIGVAIPPSLLRRADHLVQ